MHSGEAYKLVIHQICLVVGVFRLVSMFGNKLKSAPLFSAVFGEEGGEVSKCDIMSVYVITGDNREDRSSIAGRFVIDTRETRAVSGTVYAARLFDLPPELDEYKITAEEVCELFRISTKAWTTN